MADSKTNSGRRLRREAVEKQPAPGESSRVKKEGGKVFGLRRVNSGPRDINAALDRLMEEIPSTGRRLRTNLARIIIEDRE